VGSIEIYDHKNKRWVPYVPDYKKWEQHFTDVLEVRVRADRRGQYLVGSGARWRPHTHKVEPDTPVQSIDFESTGLKSIVSYKYSHSIQLHLTHPRVIGSSEFQV
jgi:hypothetical protein